MRRAFGTLLLIGLCMGCGKSPRHASYWSALSDVGTWMTGSFVCESPEGFPGVTGRVRLDIIEFWPEHDDSGVLYAEWAREEALGEPLGQAVFHLQRFKDGTAALVVFDLRDPEGYAGAWQAPGRLATLKSDDLIEREACLIRLVRSTPSRYVGGVVGRASPEAVGSTPCLVAGLMVSPEQLVWTLDDGLAARGPSRGDVYRKVANRPFR